MYALAADEKSINQIENTCRLALIVLRLKHNCWVIFH